MAEGANSLLEKITKLSLIQRILIMAGIIVAICGMYFYLIIMPKFETLAELREENDTLVTELNQVRVKASQLKKYQQMMKEVEEQFEAARAVLPENEQMRSLLESISASGKEAGLEFTLFQPGNDIEEEFYAVIPISINMQGTFYNLSSFFDKISKLPRIVKISNFKLSFPEQQSESLLLTIDCTAITYKFIEKNEKKKKKRK